MLHYLAALLLVGAAVVGTVVIMAASGVCSKHDWRLYKPGIRLDASQRL
jgi:hypothetical protein